MKTRIGIWVMAVALVIYGCDTKQSERTSRALDSLRTELTMNRNLAKTVVELGTLLDSIDANRKVLHTRMVEGASYNSYVARLRDINQYVRKTQRKIEALEKAARKSHDVAYTSAVKKLKAQLATREHELTAITEQLNYYKTNNEELAKKVSETQTELDDKLAQLKTKQEETVRLEEQVKMLLAQSKLNEGESYYARALAVEETANRTRFAPNKKKNTLKQALQLYKLAQFYGKTEADSKVAKLETRLTKPFIL